jgi:hypothetical protein
MSPEEKQITRGRSSVSPSNATLSLNLPSTAFEGKLQTSVLLRHKYNTFSFKLEPVLKYCDHVSCIGITQGLSFTFK